MRICLFSKYGRSSNLLYEGVVEALKVLKIPYLNIDINTERKESTPHWSSIPSLKGQNRPVDAQILKKIADFKPTLLFFLQYSGLPFLIDQGEALRSIVGHDGHIAFWLVDLTERVNKNTALGKLIDYFFLSNTGQIADYQKEWGINHVYFMPQGCFIAKELRKSDMLRYPLGFLGRRQREDSRYEERNRILDGLNQRFRLYEPDHILTREEMIQFYQNCTINLGLNWRNDIYLYSSDRIFNVLGSGGFYLCSYFPGIEKLVNNYNHLVWFKTLEELLYLAELYLHDGVKRETIAENGYNLAREKHTYIKRIENILHILEKKSTGFEGFL